MEEVSEKQGIIHMLSPKIKSQLVADLTKESNSSEVKLQQILKKYAYWESGSQIFGESNEGEYLNYNASGTPYGSGSCSSCSSCSSCGHCGNSCHGDGSCDGDGE